MSKLTEIIEQWKKAPPYEGVRTAPPGTTASFPVTTQDKISEIIEAMETEQFIIFNYSGSDRVAAPFAVGISSEGNPLMRAYQTRGVSVGGRSPGWRVFQIRKMLDVENDQDFFNAEEYDFDRNYPWIFRVVKTL